MRNIQKVFIGVFLSGVLLGGIGTGIAVAEFSSLSYGGRKTVGTENLVTREFDFTLPVDGKAVILGNYGYRGNWESRLVEDPSVPAGIVRYEITYNERLIEPRLFYVENEEETEQDQEEQNQEENQNQEEEQNQDGEQNQEENQNQDGETEEGADEKEPVYGGNLYLETRYKGNDFEIFMENKDRILEELKQHTLSSYDITYVTEITVKVNPETRAYVKDTFFTY